MAIIGVFEAATELLSGKEEKKTLSTLLQNNTRDTRLEKILYSAM